MRWATQFHPYSRYSPLNIEGSLDRALAKSYIDNRARDPTLKKPKTNRSLAALSTAIPHTSPIDPFAVGNSLSNWIASSAINARGSGTDPVVNLLSGLPNNGSLSIPSANNSTPPGFDSKLPARSHSSLLAAVPLQSITESQNSAPQAPNLDPRHVNAWNAITKKEEHVHLGELKLRNPTQVREDTSFASAGFLSNHAATRGIHSQR